MSRSTNVCIFEGREVEGRHRGLHTLFVEGLATPDEIVQHLTEEHQQIYFGAVYLGKKLTPSLVDPAIVMKVALLNSLQLRSFVITVETTRYLAGLMASVEFMIPLLPGHLDSAVDAAYKAKANGHYFQLKALVRNHVAVWHDGRLTENKKSEIESDKVLFSA